MEEIFQAGKGLAGLDEHQVRRWNSWYRWITLVMLAHAFLAVIAAPRTRPGRHRADLIPLTCNEIRHLFTTLITNTIRTISHRLRWSNWRRRHQARARTSHYRREAKPPSTSIYITNLGCRTSHHRNRPNVLHTPYGGWVSRHRSRWIAA